MKPINEYLLSKKHAKANTGFLDINEGDVRTKQDVIDFFEEKNFKRTHHQYLGEFYDEFEKSSAPIYWIGSFSNENDLTHWVRFGNGGKISKSNPVMFWRVNYYNTSNYSVTDYSYSISNNVTDVDHKIDTWKEFKDYVNKIFENE